MICIDNNFLVLLIKPDANPPEDPQTGLPVERVAERIELLKETWNTLGEVILIPTPVLSEFMMLSDVEADRVEQLEQFQNSQNYEIKPFDKRAALELAALYVSEKTSKTKQKKFEQIADTKTRMKFDRQIVAIAKRNKVTAIYTDDKSMRAFGEMHGIQVISTYDLPFPADPEPEVVQEDIQPSLRFGAAVAGDGKTETGDTVDVATVEDEKPKATVEGGSGENGS